MPTVRRRRSMPASAEDVWRVVSDPERLADWWPGVARVEEASPLAWTTVLSSARGRTVRADYTRVEAEAPRTISWRQELAESPFERILSESLTAVELEPEGDGATRVEVSLRQRGRGFARFGFLQLRLAAARQVNGALDGLEAVLGRRG